MKKQMIKPLTLGSAVVLTAAMAGQTFANENPFAANQLKAGYELAAATEGKCGEGKCGGDTDAKDAEGKCGEGKCGGDTDAKDAEGKCGEGKCGGDEEKSSEGKCGEGKCGS